MWHSKYGEFSKLLKGLNLCQLWQNVLVHALNKSDTKIEDKKNKSPDAGIYKYHCKWYHSNQMLTVLFIKDFGVFFSFYIDFCVWK